MYTLIIERLRVGPEQLATDNTDELLKALVAPQYLDLAKEMIRDTNSKIIDPILVCKNNETVTAFEKSLVPFTIRLSGLNVIILLSQDGNLVKLASLDQKFYSDILGIVKEEISTLSVDDGMKLLDVIERLIDYQSVLLGILIKRPEQLFESLKEVNIMELVTSIYGSVLALACTLVILKEKQPNKEKISILLEIAKQHSDVMESYADTIDIMSNKEEMELLKRSELE